MQTLEQAARAHAKEVKTRLMGRKNAETSVLESEVRNLRKENVALRDKILALQYSLSDHQARMIQQASELCAYQGIEKTVVVRRRPVGDIIADVLKDFPGITFEDLISVRRTKCLIEPRHKAMTAVHEGRPDLSFPVIGRIFGGRDHTTVLSAVRKIQANRRIENERQD